MKHTSSSARLRPLMPALLAGWALAASAADPSGDALAKRYGCLGCHSVGAKLVGPSYQEVAAKYAGQPDAIDTLVKSIREGGSGRWGDMAMPPQPAVSQADAKRLAGWIAGLGK